MAVIKVQTLWPQGNIPSLEIWLEATPFRTVGRMLFFNATVLDDEFSSFRSGDLAPSYWDIPPDERTPLERLPELPEEV